MKHLSVDTAANPQLQASYAELESMLGDAAYEVFMQVNGMSKEQLLDFTDALLTIKNHITVDAAEIRMSDTEDRTVNDCENIVTPSEIEKILEELTAEINSINDEKCNQA